MSVGASLIIVFVVAAHILLIIGVVFNRKRAICICGHGFNLPDVGKYICPGCGKMHLTGKEQKNCYSNQIIIKLRLLVD